MKVQTLVFGDRLYRVDDPEPSWHVPSPDDAAECSVCGETLTFCFAGRTDESKAGIGSYYIIPTGVRCDYFLDGWTLKKQPILISPVMSLPQGDTLS